MMECHDVLRRLWEYLDGELDPATSREVADHLSMCARCYPEYQTQMKILEATAKSWRDDPSTAVHEEFKARLRASLDAIRRRPPGPT